MPYNTYYTDILSSIHRIHHKFPSSPGLFHVKGHQDKDTKFEDLDTSAQMNVKADRLASEALHLLGSPKPFVPLDPLAYAMLDIKGVTVTRHIEHAIRSSHHLPLNDHITGYAFNGAFQSSTALTGNCFRLLTISPPDPERFSTSSDGKNSP